MALPAACVVFCASQQHTPGDLYGHISQVLASSTTDPGAYDLILDWSIMASQAGTGPNASSSTLSFAMPVILGTAEHLHEWAHKRLALTVGSTGADPSPARPTNTGNPGEWESQREGVDMATLAQVTAAVIAAIRMTTGCATTQTLGS
jgi:hypothetical protein